MLNILFNCAILSLTKKLVTNAVSAVLHWCQLQKNVNG